MNEVRELSDSRRRAGRVRAAKPAEGVMSIDVATEPRSLRCAQVQAREGLPVNRVERTPVGEMRLTRRGRVTVFITGLVAALGVLLLLLSSGSVATGEKGRAAPTKVIMVGEGDTLWDISSEIASATGESDIRRVMADLTKLNGLESGMLRAGQELRVPVLE
ncbi:MAG: LysM peptidoglycan-binding domain-containing protein [Nocardioides sp.]